MSAIATTTWQLAGEGLGTCNCDWGCPCQFNAPPTHGRCEAFAAWQVHEGHFGDTPLGGVRFANVYWFPGRVDEGNGVRQPIVDEQATPAQRDALAALQTGEHGHPFFEIFASVCPTVLEAVVAPITLVIDRKARTGSLSIPAVGESRVEPIKNPVTGEEHPARIVLPNGFEFKEAEMGNAVRLGVHSTDPMSFEHENVYAHFYEFEWSSA